MGENDKKEKIKACIAMAIIIIIILLSIIFSIKYQVEGESNMPFKLSKITIVSTAEGNENEGAKEKWNMSIYQNNDIYFSIEKNDKYNKEELIDNISIENIKIIQNPELGEIQVFMPNSSEGRLFSYSEDTIVKDNKLTYKGASKTNNKSLEIGNQGGTAVIRFANTKIGDYVSDDDEEIKHDGTMLTKTQATNENIKFKVNFDLIINLKNAKYKTNISLDLPCEENLLEKGTFSKEITDNFIFKRINN